MLNAVGNKNWFLTEYEGLDAVPFLVDLAKKIKTFRYPLENFANWLVENINNPNVKIHIVVQGEKIVGFGIAEISYELDIPFIAIQVGYVPPEIKGGVDEWMKQLKEWAKDSDIHTIRMKVIRHMEGWEKKYGFEIENYTLKKEV